MRIQRPSFSNITLLCVFYLAFSTFRTNAQTQTSSDSNVASTTQSAVTPARITQPIDAKNLVVLHGNVHPLARPEYDQGSVADAQPLKRMLLLLRRSPEQETALLKLLDDQQDKSSPNYHAWLTPQQFGAQFGPADADVQTVTDWLASQGFTEIKVGTGRTIIEFSGNVAQVRSAFHTEIHRFLVDNHIRTANISDPQIPGALAPVVAGVVSLHNFPRISHAKVLGQFRRDIAKSGIQPLFSFPNPYNGRTFYALGPGDFATIYNTKPLVTSGNDGQGQTIAIVGETNINVQDVQQFRNMFGLPAKFDASNIILNGEDPGVTSIDEEAEADLDVEWSGATAPGATVKLVVSASTPASAGVDLSALYIVEHNLAGVMSESYGSCEKALGSAENAFYNNLWQQAAAQGITVFVSSGDGGSAGCDDFNQPLPASQGLAVSGLASTPFNVSVGGTDFDDVNTWSTYWNSTNDPTGTSAKSYIPEIPWNENCAQISLTGCGATAPQGSVNIVAGSGGQSSLYAKPKWQMGVSGMPNDNHRDQPDVSLFASPGFDGTGYVYCQSDLTISGLRSCDINATSGLLDFGVIGGTSASAPAFAGVMALVNQYQSSHGGTNRQGNANYTFYALAKRTAATCASSATQAAGCVFNDIRKGNSFLPTGAPGIGTNSVPCTGGSFNCSVSTPASTGVLVDPAHTSTEAWTAAAGYDMATGLGTINANNLATNWGSVSTIPTTTTLTLSPTTGINHGTENVTVNVTVKPNSGVGVAAGDVVLIATFSDGTTQGLDHFSLTNGAVTGLKAQSLPGGTYQVSAHYAGDGTNAPSDSTPVQVTVGTESSQAFIVMPTFDPQTGVVNGNASSMVYGAPAIIRVYVTNSGAAANPSGPPSPLCAQVNDLTCPSGTVALTDNGIALDAGTYSLNSAGYTRDLHPFLLGGTHQLVAQYSGDTSYDKSTSATDIVTVTPAPTRTDFFSSNFYAVVGENFSLSVNTATSVLGGKAATGTFSFYDGGAPLAGSVSTSPSQGNIPGYAPYIYGFIGTTFTTVGQHNITATYSGDSNYASSTTPNPLTVNARYTDAITISVDTSSVLYGNAVNVTGTVTAGHASPALSGSITFYSPFPGSNGPITTNLTTDANGNQVMTATFSTTPQSSEYINVYYNGDPNYVDGSNSVWINVIIPDFSLNVPSTPLTITAGQPGTLQVSVVPATNNPSPVMLSCSGDVPVGYSCSMQPSTANLANGATSTTTLTLSPVSTGTVIKNSASSRRATVFPFSATPLSPSSTLGATALALFLALLWARKRRRLRLCFSVGAVLLLSILGCGGGGASFGGGGSGGGGGGTVATATTTTVSTSAAKIAQQTPVTFTATVVGTGATKPTGTVAFYASGNWYGQANLENGTATLTTPIARPGLFIVTAYYGGDALNNPSTSVGVSQIVTGTTMMQVNGQTSTLYHSATVTITLQ